MASPELLDFRRWLRTAKPGADFVYSLSSEESDATVFSAARGAYAAGEIALFQSRVAPGQVAYHARKISTRAWSFIAACGKRVLESPA